MAATELSTERPLVTFALFAYNQERFIREAVEGALSQDYSPLQIILSDDCSSDRTFEIMQEMAGVYKGPHDIVLNRNEENLGIGGHVKRVAELAEGEIIVMAAGDDVSVSERTRKIVYQFVDNVYAVVSNVTRLKKCKGLNSLGRQVYYHGRVVKIDKTSIEHMSSRSFVVRKGGGVGVGAAYAYRRECFECFDHVANGVDSEDRILPTAASVLGKIMHIGDSLVHYRILNESVSRSAKYKSPPANPKHRKMLARIIQYYFNVGVIGRIEYIRLLALNKISLVVYTITSIGKPPGKLVEKKYSTFDKILFGLLFVDTRLKGHIGIHRWGGS